MAMNSNAMAPVQFPLLMLLHPREQSWLLMALLAAGLLLSGLGMTFLGVPLWVATAMTLVLLLYPAVLKWRADARRWGRPVMVLSNLLALQGFHGVEHITQWLQFHVLGWPAKASSGLISPANAEVVHFVWNWIVLCTVVYLVRSGVRNVWAWLLLAWALAHTLEHTYLFAQYLHEITRLASLGQPLGQAQGLPGVLGKGGWLATQGATQGSLAFVCSLAPALKTALRLDVHFWWNVGETALLFSAAHTHLARHLRAAAVRSATTAQRMECSGNHTLFE
jgi:hypothetical protein